MKYNLNINVDDIMLHFDYLLALSCNEQYYISSSATLTLITLFDTIYILMILKPISYCL